MELAGSETNNELKVTKYATFCNMNEWTAIWTNLDCDERYHQQPIKLGTKQCKNKCLLSR
jgi:hypothetical protein